MKTFIFFGETTSWSWSCFMLFFFLVGERKIWKKRQYLNLSWFYCLNCSSATLPKLKTLSFWTILHKWTLICDIITLLRVVLLSFCNVSSIDLTWTPEWEKSFPVDWTVFCMKFSKGYQLYLPEKKKTLEETLVWLKCV